MKKIILFLMCLVSINVAMALQKQMPFPHVPWEVMGVNDDQFRVTRIERLKAPEGWIVKILTIDKASDPSTVKYMYIPDSKHEWQFNY